MAQITHEQYIAAVAQLAIAQLTDPEDIEHRLAKVVDLMIEGEPGRHQPTTVIDMTGEEPMVARAGLGPIDAMTLGR